MGMAEKLTTVDIKKLSREDLETAYRRLLRVSLQKTDLIKHMSKKTLTCAAVERIKNTSTQTRRI